MYELLDRYCDEVNPVDDCGRYQQDVDLAQSKLRTITIQLSRYDSWKVAEVVDDLLFRFEDIFDRSGDLRSQFLAAYFYVSLADVHVDQSIDETDEFVNYLFGNTSSSSSSSYDDRYTTDRSTPASYGNFIDNIWSLGSTTRIDVYNEVLSIGSTNKVELGIKAQVDDYVASANRGYRVVAVSTASDKVIAANYEARGSYRSLRMYEYFYQGDELTLYLLCDDCNFGEPFPVRGRMQGRSVIDAQTFEIDMYGDHFDQRYPVDHSSCGCGYDCDTDGHDHYDDYRGGDRYGSEQDFSIRRVEYDYDVRSRHTEVLIATTIRNESRYEGELEWLGYTITVDGHRVHSNDYDIDHIKTDCDDTSVSSSRGRNLDIEGYDECEILVEIELDSDDVWKEDVQIGVKLESRDDDYSGNNYETVRFTVR